MTVTFNRAQLAKVAEAALINHDQARINQQAEIELWKANRSFDHKVKNRAGLRRLRDALTAALKADKVLTRQEIRDKVGVSDVENLFYYPPRDYDVSRECPKVTGLLSPAEAVEIRSLLAVLNAATGDLITANELKLLGLKNLSPVFIAAANEPATPPKRKR